MSTANITSTARTSADPSLGVLGGQKIPRIMVFSDIGDIYGKYEPDDSLAMTFLFLAANTFDIEGLVSSKDSKPIDTQNINGIIDLYAQDYANLSSHDSKYPSPEELRKLVRAGSDRGFSPSRASSKDAISPGAKSLIEAAHKSDSRPLNVLLWGGATEVAEAIHADPSIIPKIRVFMNGSPGMYNDTSLDPTARDYLYQRSQNSGLYFAELRDLGNPVPNRYPDGLSAEAFVRQYIDGHGALGDYAATRIKTEANGFKIKKVEGVDFSDGATYLYFLRGDYNDPLSPSWGGTYNQPDPSKDYYLSGWNKDVVSKYQPSFLSYIAERADWAKSGKKGSNGGSSGPSDGGNSGAGSDSSQNNDADMPTSDGGGTTGRDDSPSPPVNDAPDSTPDQSADGVIQGTSNDDTLQGTNGDDIIIGGKGGDRLTGGSGSDIFRYTGPWYAERGDVITDFQVGKDQLDFSALLNPNLHNSATPFADYIKLSENNGNTTVEFNAKGDKRPRFSRPIVTLEGTTGLSKADISLGISDSSSLDADGSDSDDSESDSSGSDSSDSSNADSPTDGSGSSSSSSGDLPDTDVGTGVDSDMDADVDPGIPTTSGTSLFGSMNGDILRSVDGNDVMIQGLAGDDTLIGGSGNDTLMGGSGDDRLTGGEGSDRFIYMGPWYDDRIDTITDFEVGQDQIDFSGLFTSSMYSSDTPFSDYIQLSESTTGTTVGVAVRGDTQPDFFRPMVVLEGATGLTATDFILTPPPTN